VNLEVDLGARHVARLHEGGSVVDCRPCLATRLYAIGFGDCLAGRPSRGSVQPPGGALDQIELDPERAHGKHGLERAAGARLHDHQAQPFEFLQRTVEIALRAAGLRSEFRQR
jgi:hypothetical protein